jgi:hypothetical protein
MSKSIKIFLFSFLLSINASAVWELEVSNRQTKEIKKYVLEDNEDFVIPLGIKDTRCICTAQKADLINESIVISRQLQCDYKSFSTWTWLPKILNNNFVLPSNLMFSVDDKSFFITLYYK